MSFILSIKIKLDTLKYTYTNLIFTHFISISLFLMSFSLVKKKKLNEIQLHIILSLQIEKIIQIS